jgi:hypothetical protein
VVSYASMQWLAAMAWIVALIGAVVTIDVCRYAVEQRNAGIGLIGAAVALSAVTAAAIAVIIA